MNYLTQEINRLLKFNFYKFNYYFFTIKFNKPHLYDNAKDLVSMIDYIKLIIQNSTIQKVVYCFELDSKKHLHVHGICSSEDKLIYTRLYRERGVHHNFKLIESPVYHDIQYCMNSKYLKAICHYMLKDILGNLIMKSFKGNNYYNITTKAYWY